MSQCALDGESAVLLATTPLDRGKAVYCVEMTPTHNFTHVLFVYRQLVDGFTDGYARHGESYCLAGSCPAP